MKKSRCFQVLALTAILACIICGQQALAESPHHLQIRAVSGNANGVHSEKTVKEKAALEQLSSGFGVLPPVDGGGTDEWPCFGGGADCSGIASGGVVIGTPAYTQSLTNCDASASGAPNCGQVFWFYEDDTGDTTDDLIVSITVKQGAAYILDTGPFDFGANPFGGSPGTVIVISDDTAFGTLGQTGSGNGFCVGSTETCVDPKAGAATVTVTTNVGKSTIKATFNMFLK